MARKSERQIMVESIIAAHGGKAYFSLTDVHKITGRGINDVSRMLYEHGIPVKKIGPRKCISAYQLVEVMHSDRIASIDN